LQPLRHEQLRRRTMLPLRAINSGSSTAELHLARSEETAEEIR